MEARNGKDVRSTEWVARLPDVIKALNNEETRLIGMKTSNAIEKSEVNVQASAPQRLKN